MRWCKATTADRYVMHVVAKLIARWDAVSIAVVLIGLIIAKQRMYLLLYITQWRRCNRRDRRAYRLLQWLCNLIVLSSLNFILFIVCGKKKMLLAALIIAPSSNVDYIYHQKLSSSRKSHQTVGIFRSMLVYNLHQLLLASSQSRHDGFAWSICD